MLCDRPGAIEDGSKVYDTCNHLEMFKEDLARESLVTAKMGYTSIADHTSHEVIRGQHIPILFGLGPDYPKRRSRRPNQ
jgi:hypothetical protein